MNSSKKKFLTRAVYLSIIKVWGLCPEILDLKFGKCGLFRRTA